MWRRSTICALLNFLLHEMNLENFIFTYFVIINRIILHLPTYKNFQYFCHWSRRVAIDNTPRERTDIRSIQNLTLIKDIYVCCIGFLKLPVECCEHDCPTLRWCVRDWENLSMATTCHLRYILFNIAFWKRKEMF